MDVVIAGAAEPDEQEVSVAEAALQQIRIYLAHHDEPFVTLIAEPEPATLTVPRPAVELLAKILAHMAAGRGVSIVPAHAELTTQQAADLLNVSRPFLIGLLKAGEIEYRTVGAHRRIKAESLLSYMAQDDQRRREAADELTSLAQEMGT